MFEYIRVFDFTDEIDKKTEKIELNLNVEFGRALMSTISTSKGKLRHHLSNPCSNFFSVPLLISTTLKTKVSELYYWEEVKLFEIFM